MISVDCPRTLPSPMQWDLPICWTSFRQDWKWWLLVPIWRPSLIMIQWKCFMRGKEFITHHKILDSPVCDHLHTVVCDAHRQVSASQTATLRPQAYNLLKLISTLTLILTRFKHSYFRGIVPSLGHDCQADEQEILDALSVSKTQPCHLTNLYNVSKFHHR